MNNIQSSRFEGLEYHQKISEKFANIFIRYHDNSSAQNFSRNSTLHLPSQSQKKILQREEILFSQYQMVKKGKKFNTLESRRLKIDEGILIQVNEKGQQRQLPYPVTIIQEHRDSLKNSPDALQWHIQSCPYRLNLQFDERSSVSVYFQKLLNCQEIHSFLVFESKPHYKDTLKKINDNIFKAKIINKFVNDLFKARQSQSLMFVKKNRQQQKYRITQILKSQYTSKNMLKNFIYQWATKAKSIRQTPLKEVKNAQKIDKLLIKVSQLEFIQYTKQSSEENSLQNDKKQKIIGGEIKIWINNMTHHQKIRFGEENNCRLQKIQSYYDDDKYLPFNLPLVNKFKVAGQENLFNIENISLNTCLQLQMEIAKSLQEQIVKQRWRSQRWHLKDWAVTWLQESKGPKIMMLHCCGKKLLIKLTIKQFNCQLLSQSFRNPQRSLEKFDPSEISVLKSLIPNQYFKKCLKKYHKKKEKRQSIIDRTLIPDQAKETINQQIFIPSLFHSVQKKYEQSQATTFLSYQYYSRLYQLLNLEALITKFFANYPFNQYIHVKKPGTFVYQYLIFSHNPQQKAYLMKTQRSLNDYERFDQEKLFYHDAEKLLWKFQQYNLRRFLSALKAFDQIPRINFTQPFYWLCLRCLEIVNKDALNNSSGDRYDQMFENSVIGKQSKAFFLVLALLKVAAPILLYQPQKKALSHNSLLFHYILKCEYPEIYQRILEIQINIEAFFGIQMTSLFSGLLSVDFFMIVLEKFIAEKKLISDQQKFKKIYGNHSLSLISCFLTIITLVHRLFGKLTEKCLYQSAENYLSFIKKFCKPAYISQYISDFTIQYELNYQICGQYLQNNIKKSFDYSNILEKIQKFYNSTQYTVEEQQGTHENNTNTALTELTLGQILQKLYSSFNCYKHKNQGDIRKIFIIVDNISLGNRQPEPINNHHNENFKKGVQNSKRLIRSLVISVYQGNSKLYYHQLVNINAQEVSTSIYNNIKHCIELKLLKLDLLEFIIYEKISSSLQMDNKNNKASTESIIYSCKIDPRELPSNYYIQKIYTLDIQERCSSNALEAIGISDKRTFTQYQKQVNNITLHRDASIMMQVYIKDSCEVQYIDNMVPQDYINHFIFLNELSSARSPQSSPSKSQQYFNQQKIIKLKNDLLFCNHYFRTYRMPENNFNLLYSKLGWFGNHYLIPDDRIALIYKQKFFQQNQVKENFTKNLIQSGLANSSRVEVTPFNQLELERIYKILFYSRCIYGRGLIPKSNLFIKTSAESQSYFCSKLVYKTNSIDGTDQIKSSSQKFRLESFKHTNDIANTWYDSASSTVGYTLNNFNGPHSSFIAYYWKMTKQLPIIRYLGFRTRQFYILGECKLQIELKIPISLSPTKSKSSNSKQPLTYTQIHSGNKVTNFIKNKIMPSKQNSSQFQNNPNIIREDDLRYFLKKITIVFSNNCHPSKSLQPEQFPKKFLTFKDLSSQQAQILCQNFDDYVRYQIANKSMEESKINLMFTYCECFVYLDEFAYLLKLNISKYYCTPKLKSNSPTKNKPSTKAKEKLENKKERKNQWQYIIQFNNKQIPNFQIYELYQILLQTDEQLILTINEQYLPKNGFSHKHQKQRQTLKSAWRRYEDWGYINERWKPIQALVLLTSPHYCLFYAQEKYSNKKFLIDAENVMLGINREPNELQIIKFTDQQLKGIEICVKKELIYF